MLDKRFVRENIDAVNKAMQDRNFDWDFAAFLKAEKFCREAIGQEEELQAKRNSISKSIAVLMREGKMDEAEQAKVEVSKINEDLSKSREKRVQADEKLKSILFALPNIPHESTLVGIDENDNLEIRRWGTPREFDFDFKAHWDLGSELGIIDFERGVKLAKSRFYLLSGTGAKLERALINFMLDTHTSRGYKEFWVPVLANAECLTGTGQLPKFKEDLFKTTSGLYLIPTAEVPLINTHRGETLDAKDLPIKYCGFTTCFRQEAGAAGRDTRGIIRVHQFSKVEMVKFTVEENSQEELDSMVADAENILQLLGLPYRVVSLCTGDIGFSSCKTYDLEVWLPAYNEYKEISSCSDCWDFQARRANIKYKDPKNFMGSKFVHTLNGSGIAVGRTMAAVFENYQQPDGSVKVPDVLVPYMGGMEIIKPE
ncbi:MAG: serine--tRNA ligase [Eggerthellaceae bacterium]|nr:serine--tRNA ligase [Eggerthellaceae bacterium]